MGMLIYWKMEDSGMPINKSGIEEQTRMRLNSEASLLARNVTKKIRELMTSKVDSFGIFNIVMEPISFSIDFVLFNAFTILLEYSNDHFNWFLEDENSKISVDTTNYSIDEIESFCNSMEITLKKQLPEKYFKAYGW